MSARFTRQTCIGKEEQSWLQWASLRCKGHSDDSWFLKRTLKCDTVDGDQKTFATVTLKIDNEELKNVLDCIREYGAKTAWEECLTKRKDWMLWVRFIAPEGFVSKLVRHIENRNFHKRKTKWSGRVKKILYAVHSGAEFAILHSVFPKGSIPRSRRELRFSM